jgi:hypothetical protein
LADFDLFNVVDAPDPFDFIAALDFPDDFGVVDFFELVDLPRPFDPFDRRASG